MEPLRRAAHLRGASGRAAERTGGVAQRIGLPLITHNRWIDPASPYPQVPDLGVAAVDPRVVGRIMDSIAAGGVVCYEQDWLNMIYDHSPDLRTTPGVGEAFTDGMARAARRNAG